MGKLRRRAELQHKYDGVLQWSIPKTVSVIISDYQRQETILEWIVNNWDLFCDLSPPRVWRDFLYNCEKTPDTPIEELLHSFVKDYPVLCEIAGLKVDILLLSFSVEALLVVEPSVQPMTGLGEYVKLYAEKEARLEELMETN